MNPPSKDEAVRAVVAELDGLLARLSTTTEALAAILKPPEPTDPHGQEVPVL